jgi:hypothetical protein
VVKGSATDKRCAAYFPTLEGIAKTHLANSQAFLKDYDAASAAAAKTSIVPANGKALSPAVEDAIAGAFRTAGPDVIERVRRGFLAINTRDWQLAAAYFKDALNHAPGHEGLRRLLVLAQEPSPAAKSSIQLPSDSDIKFLFPGDVPPPSGAPRPPAADDVYYFRPAKGYTRMTLDGARQQQLLDTMAGKAPGSIVNIR